MQFETLPKVKFDRSTADQYDPFIRTGHYDWATDTITLSINGRQVKDILRTFCHELYHAWQHRRDGITFEGLDKSGTLAENEDLRAYEEEAYAKGNVLFRAWTEQYTA